MNAAGIPIAVHRSSAHWLRENAQARAIDAVAAVDDPEHGATLQAGFPVRMSATPPRVRHPRRPLDSDEPQWRERTGPAPGGGGASRPWPAGEPGDGALAGLRVLDLTQVWAGPTCGRIFGELGADVVKVNSPENWVLGHLLVNSAKRSTLIDLTTAAGHDALTRLLPDADVVMQNFSADAADRLDLGEDDVRGVRDDVVYASLSCYGYDGPRGDLRGWEPLGQTPTGMMLRAGGGGAPLGTVRGLRLRLRAPARLRRAARPVPPPPHR